MVGTPYCLVWVCRGASIAWHVRWLHPVPNCQSLCPTIWFDASSMLHVTHGGRQTSVHSFNEWNAFNCAQFQVAHVKLFVVSIGWQASFGHGLMQPFWANGVANMSNSIQYECGQLQFGRVQLYTLMIKVRTNLYVDLTIAPIACTSAATHHARQSSTWSKKSTIERMPRDKPSNTAISWVLQCLSKKLNKTITFSLALCLHIMAEMTMTKFLTDANQMFTAHAATNNVT